MDVGVPDEEVAEGLHGDDAPPNSWYESRATCADLTRSHTHPLRNGVESEGMDSRGSDVSRWADFLPSAAFHNGMESETFAE